MGIFRSLTAAKADEDRWRPPKVITVDPRAFASEWADRPLEPVEMGLRVIPDEDLQTARAEAAKFAQEMHDDLGSEDAVDCFNDALLRWIIARGTCAPDDVRQPFFSFAEDTVKAALSTEGVKSISFELEVFKTETSPLLKPVDTEEELDLAHILTEGAPWGAMGDARARGTRRLLRVVLDRFSEAFASADGAAG